MTDRRLLIVAAVLAAMIRADLVVRRETISVDGVQYIAAARQFRAGAWRRGLKSFYPPGYPLAIAATTSLMGDPERAGLLVSATAGVAALWPLAALGRRAGLSPWALGATLVGFAVSPYPARYAATVRSEALYGLLLLLGVWLAAVAREAGGVRPAVAAGLAVGAAYLVRPEGLFLLLPLGAALRRPRQIAALVAAAGVGVAPYVLHLHSDTGRWLLSRKAANVLSLGIHEAVGSGDVVSQRDSDAVPISEVLSRERGVLLRKLARDSVRTFGAFAECVHFVYLPFLLVGLWRIGRPPNVVWWLAHAVVWFYVAFFAAVYVDRRFYNGLVPLALLWVGVGAEVARERWLAGRAQRTAIAVVVVVAAILAKTLWVNDPSGWVRAAGAEIRQRGGAGTAVAAPDLRVSYYADGWAIDARFPLDAKKLAGVLESPARWLVVRDGDVDAAAQPMLGAADLVATLPAAAGSPAVRIFALRGSRALTTGRTG